MKPVLSALPLVLLSPALTAQPGLGVHEHGVGRLSLALQEQHLVLELMAPAADIVGFEYHPVTDEEQARYRAGLERLQQADALFTLPAAAGCRLERVALAEQEPHSEHEHEHDNGEGDEHQAGHNDILVHYAYHCEQPQALQRLDLALFETFSSFNRIELQAILPTGQLAATLTPEQPQAHW